MDENSKSEAGLRFILNYKARQDQNKTSSQSETSSNNGKVNEAGLSTKLEDKESKKRKREEEVGDTGPRIPTEQGASSSSGTAGRRASARADRISTTGRRLWQYPARLARVILYGGCMCSLACPVRFRRASRWGTTTGLYPGCSRRGYNT